MFRKGYGTENEFIVNSNLTGGQAEALSYCFIKNDTENNIGKAPRRGAARGVQSSLGQRKTYKSISSGGSPNQYFRRELCHRLSSHALDVWALLFRAGFVLQSHTTIR